MQRQTLLLLQVRECATALLHIAKQHDIPIFLVGHVTKSGDIAGPKVLEHIVDVVLYMEGEKHQSFRWVLAACFQVCITLTADNNSFTKPSKSHTCSIRSVFCVEQTAHMCDLNS